jgi:protein-S-isoprenylcysteine O-methyltransferase Ste14
MFYLILLFGILSNLAFYGGLLFLPAGTLHWWRAWVFLAVVGAGAVASMLTVFRDNRELLRERLKPPVQKGQPLADKILVVLLLLTYGAQIALIPLDVFRFHLMAKPGSGAAVLGLALYMVGWVVVSLTFKENAFAAPVVRYQEERKQKVIDTGVYALVRHPMYFGAALLMVGLPLWLESWAGALLAAVPIATLAVRIVFEERFLKERLEGYGAYTQRVRYRLIPFLW